MKTRLIAFALSVVSVLAMAGTASAQSVKGEKSVGLRGGFTTCHDAPVAGLYFQYRFSRHFRLSPQIDYYFRHHDTDAFAFNINADVPFAIGSSGKFNLYPLAGVSLTSWNFHHRSTGEEADDATSRKLRAGVNVGGGAEYYVTPTLKLALEGRYNWVKHYDGGVFTLSIGYMF